MASFIVGDGEKRKNVAGNVFSLPPHLHLASAVLFQAKL
jgi:hypothetical protein